MGESSGPMEHLDKRVYEIKISGPALKLLINSLSINGTFQIKHKGPN